MPAGRPRDRAVDDAIRLAVFELIAEQGYQAVTMEGIAARSGVAKQTVYRRYSGRGQALVGALTEHGARHIPVPDTGTLAGDLAALLRDTFDSLTAGIGAVLRAVIAETLHDEALAELYRREHVELRRDVVRELLARARARGEIGPADDEFLVDLVFGPMWYRLLIGHAPLTETLARQLAAAVAAAAAIPAD
ncbi:TetR/AcrR family transcriptional regulator [Solihabitans fulvus]|uniref:TetR/AcrR family transcriptional regulator n=1 Tax=Solihabitans fulvus TaxID=1892852 RepID=A0A5B2WWG5_9PSEU|nr:TetR/AcrR family transcriptional regulator [Solihabitans fulvus]KAA2255210.1 TetR/AcrR family transcriptional regulator [Solihabitans fulvus]